MSDRSSVPSTKNWLVAQLSDLLSTERTRQGQAVTEDVKAADVNAIVVALTRTLDETIISINLFDLIPDVEINGDTKLTDILNKATWVADLLADLETDRKNLLYNQLSQHIGTLIRTASDFCAICEVLNKTQQTGLLSSKFQNLVFSIPDAGELARVLNSLHSDIRGLFIQNAFNHANDLIINRMLHITADKDISGVIDHAKKCATSPDIHHKPIKLIAAAETLESVLPLINNCRRETMAEEKPRLQKNKGGEAKDGQKTASTRQPAKLKTINSEAELLKVIRQQTNPATLANTLIRTHRSPACRKGVVGLITDRNLTNLKTILTAYYLA